MENLQHLRYYFEDENEIDTFVATDNNLRTPEQKIQIARMRRSRAAFRQNEWRNENHSTTPSAAELDDLAEEGTLGETELPIYRECMIRLQTTRGPAMAKPKETPPSVHSIAISGPCTIRACHLEAWESRIYLYIAKHEADKIQEP